LTATDEATKISGFTTLTVAAAGKAPILRKVTISPLNPEIKTGQPVQFTAMGDYSDKSTHEITNAVEWKSSDEKVLAINAEGLATPSLRSGNPLISGIDKTTKLHQSTTTYVEMPGVKRLTLTPKSASVISGEAEPVTAMAILAGGARMKVNHAVEWTFYPDTAMMIWGNSHVQGGDPGDVTIEAFEPFSEEKDTMTLKVLPPVLRRIKIESPSPTISINQTLQLTAEGILSNGNPSPTPLGKVHWTTSKSNVIDVVTQTGEATAKAVGKSEITATDLTTGVEGILELEAVP
jgi:hypothetical protein